MEGVGTRRAGVVVAGGGCNPVLVPGRGVRRAWRLRVADHQVNLGGTLLAGPDLRLLRPSLKTLVLSGTNLTKLTTLDLSKNQLSGCGTRRRCLTCARSAPMVLQQ